MTKNKYSSDIKSNIDNVKPILIEALDFLRSCYPQLSEDDECDFRLIYTELLVNAVIHGNNEDETKTVSFSIEVDERNVYSTVTDEGLGFDFCEILHSCDSEEGLQRESGRGVKLAYYLAEKVEFNETGNSVRLFKKVAFNE